MSVETTTMKHEIDKDVKVKLWEMVRPQVEQPLSLFLIRPGIKPKKGQTKSEAQYEVMLQVCKDMYLAGLERGYDMGYEVAGGDT